MRSVVIDYLPPAAPSAQDAKHAVHSQMSHARPCSSPLRALESQAHLKDSVDSGMEYHLGQTRSLNSVIGRHAKAAAGCLQSPSSLALQYASKGLRCRHCQGHESRHLPEDRHSEREESADQERSSGHDVLLYWTHQECIRGCRVCSGGMEPYRRHLIGIWICVFGNSNKLGWPS